MSRCSTTSVGTPFNPRNLIDDLKRDANKAGIGKVTVHELRHTAGSLMLQAGKTMTTVSKILGHSSVGVTEKSTHTPTTTTNATRFRLSHDSCDRWEAPKMKIPSAGQKRTRPRFHVSPS
jgi:integrase